MARTNQDKITPVDESILDETPPNINEPQTTPTESENEESSEVPDKEEVENEEIVPLVPSTEDTETISEVEETQEDKDQRYKAQQTEAQIQAAKNRALINKVDEGINLPEPTVDDLQKFVAQDGVNWEDLTSFEQATARRTYKAEKSLALIREATESTKKIDQWAETVDTFIDSTDGKPEFIKLSSHEADFRKFAMQESHRGTPIDILLSSFLYNLPPKVKKRGSLFENGTGGEKTEKPGKLTDADTVANLRRTNPREYKRQLRLGNIELEA